MKVFTDEEGKKWEVYEGKERALSDCLIRYLRPLPPPAKSLEEEIEGFLPVGSLSPVEKVICRIIGQRIKELEEK